MMRMFSRSLAATLFSLAVAQFPPKPEGVTTIKSKFHEGVTISYKEPGICETTPGVKSYSGYVHLPPGLLSDIAGEPQDYPINTFFWFFESRKDPENAPLSIWLNGGPGGSSLMGLLQENGPCMIGSDSNSTYLNPYSWNNEVNMLYLDQPSLVGFSYDKPTNGTFDFITGIPTPTDFSDGIPEQNNTFYVGTFGSQNASHTANATIHAAHAMWHFAQTWFEEFPFYKPHDEKISLWTESYGGKYGPTFFRLFQEQNERIANGTISEPGSHFIHLDTLGIINGCIDNIVQQSSYADIAYNNTYDIKAINQTQYETMLDIFEKPGGCQDQLLECRSLLDEYDPEYHGYNITLNAICHEASEYCSQAFVGPYMNTSNRGWFDFGHPKADPFPAPYLIGYLTQHWVQKALGVPINFTISAMTVNDAFSTTADFTKSGFLESIGYLLESGVKVALEYGDRDFACNWIGGERSSLAVKYSGSEKFKSAGYTPLLTSTLEEAGQVRQYGNFSFSRVYQAGHEVPSYQPEISYDIFMRSLFNKDIALGVVDISDDYITSGPSDTWHIKNIPPVMPEPVCYVLKPDSCTEEQWAMVLNETAVVENYLVVDRISDDELETLRGKQDDAQQRLGDYEEL